jgi:hypothetical protein
VNEYNERNAELEDWIDERDAGLPLEELMGEAPTEEPEAA